MEYLRDLLAFASTVLHKWVFLVTGSIFAAAFTVWTTHKQKPIPRRIGAIVAVVLLFLAFFNTWRQEHASAEWRGKKVVELSAQVAQLQAQLNATPALPTQQVTQSGSDNNQTTVGPNAQINQQSSGDCSPNNIGNGNTTNCVPRSRAMPDATVGKFSAALAKVHGTLRVVPFSSAIDVSPLTQQMCDAAHQAQWAIACLDPRNVGRHAAVKGLDCYSEDWTSADAIAFKKAIKAVGLTCSRYEPRAYDFGNMTFGGTSGVTVVIGDP